MLEIPANLWQRVVKSGLWRSIFRHGYPDSRKNQSLAVFTNVFLHLHPVKVRRHALAIPYTWVIGVLLLFITFFLSFTGYLLPWDQLAIWAVTVGTNMVGATPLVGSEINFLLRGSIEVTGNTLLRFYVLHVVALPLLGGFLMA